MDDHVLFLMVFMFVGIFGAYVAMFFDIGGDKALKNTIIRIINARNEKKKKDI